MIVLAVLLNAVLGALWRRWVGGWRPFGWEAPFGRALKHAAMIALTWPLWITLPWAVAGLLTAALFAWFHVRHDNGGPGWRPVYRYGPFGLGYVIARNFVNDLPCTGQERALIEPRCWTCIGELWLGGTTFAVVAMVLLFGA